MYHQPPHTGLYSSFDTMTQAFRIGHCIVLPRTRQVMIDGREARIGGRAFDLLLALIDARDRVASAEELADRIWPHVAVEPNNLYVQVWALRRAFGREALTTVARRGYRLAARVELLDLSDPRAAQRVPHTASMRPRPDAAATGADADDVDAHAQNLLRALRTHRRVTVVGADESMRAALCAALCDRLRRTSGASVWRVSPAALFGEAVPLADTHRVLDRLRRLDAILLLEGADVRARRTVANLSCAAGSAADLRVLATAARARALPGEHLFRLPNGERTVPADAAQNARTTALLRWRTRGAPTHAWPRARAAPGQ